MFSSFLRLTVSRGLSKSIVPCNASWTVPTLANLCRQSTLQPTTSNPRQVSTNSLLPEEEVNEFLAVFPEVLDSLLDGDTVSLRKDCPDFIERMAELITYAVPTGGKKRAHTFLAAYNAFEKPENLTEENLKLARVMAWIVEMVQAASLMGDDIDDGAQMRRGKVSWFKKTGASRDIIYDAFIIGFSIQTVLKTYFSDHHCFLPVVKCLNKMGTRIGIGEVSCSFYSRKKGQDLDYMTDPTLFHWIAENKFAYCTYLPLIPPMYLANIHDEKLLGPASKFCEDLAIYYQMQNDYGDFAGTGTGKFREDVRLGKCSWVAMKVLQLANPNQKKIMEAHFGRNNEESEKIIYNLYEELDLPRVYRTCEKEIFDGLRQQIDNFPEGLPRQFFYLVCEDMIPKKFS